LQRNQQILELLHGEFFGCPCGRSQHQNNKNPYQAFHNQVPPGKVESAVTLSHLILSLTIMQLATSARRLKRAAAAPLMMLSVS
jgi:hypothetical protein